MIHRMLEGGRHPPRYSLLGHPAPGGGLRYPPLRGEPRNAPFSMSVRIHERNRNRRSNYETHIPANLRKTAHSLDEISNHGISDLEAESREVFFDWHWLYWLDEFALDRDFTEICFAAG
jgi:hypothetical protein